MLDFFPLLDLYIELDDKLDDEIYLNIFKDFESLWGLYIHFIVDDLNNYHNLDNLLKTLNRTPNLKYSFLNGIKEKNFNYIKMSKLGQLSNKTNAIAILINEVLIQDIKYSQYIRKILDLGIKLETYFNVDLLSEKYLEQIIEFCNFNNIKACIVDIDKKAQNRIMGKEYERFLIKVNEIRELNKNVNISLAECPYVNINKYNNILGGCSGGISSCMIDKSGNVVPCYYLKDISVGNVKVDRLSEIWKCSDLFGKLRNRENLKGKCKNCKYRLCCGGCRAEAFYQNRDIFEEDNNCWVGE